LANDAIHQSLIARFTILKRVVVPEIVRFVDYDEVVVAPVHAGQWHAERFTTFAQQVSVAQNVVTEAVFD
jgi:hypothetical protein